MVQPGYLVVCCYGGGYGDGGMYVLPALRMTRVVNLIFRRSEVNFGRLKVWDKKQQERTSKNIRNRY